MKKTPKGWCEQLTVQSSLTNTDGRTDESGEVQRSRPGTCTEFRAKGYPASRDGSPALVSAFHRDEMGPGSGPQVVELIPPPPAEEHLPELLHAMWDQVRNANT